MVTAREGRFPQLADPRHTQPHGEGGSDEVVSAFGSVLRGPEGHWTQRVCDHDEALGDGKIWPLNKLRTWSAHKRKQDEEEGKR